VQYVNRSSELEYITDTINNREASMIFVEYDKSSGISEFLIESAKTMKSGNVFLLDVSEETDVTRLFMRNLIKDNKNRAAIQSIADNRIGVKDSNILNSLIKIAPYIGDTASEILSPKKALPVYSGDYSTLYDELLFPFLNEIRKDSKVVIYLDSAEKMNTPSLEFISRILNDYYNIFIVAAIEYGNINSIKLKNKLTRKHPFSVLRFLSPDVKMTQLLAEHYGLNCTEDMATEIQYEASTNIHRIIEIIRNYKSSELFVFGKLHSAIVVFLSVMPFGLSKTEIQLFMESSEILFKNEDLANALQVLVTKNYIKAYENKYKIVASTHPNVIKVLENAVDIFYYKIKALDLICINGWYKTNFNYLHIAYNIAAESKNTKIHMLAKELVIYSVSVGSKLDDIIIINAAFDKSSKRDCLIATLYFMQLREFEVAIKYVGHIKETSIAQPLYAILLNRCRKHNKAESELKKGINRITNANERAILYAYLISNYVHANKINKAKEAFLNIDDDVKMCMNYSYVLRNYATIFKPEKALMLSMEAKHIFEQGNDTFGLYTTEANINRFLCETGDVQVALTKLIEIYEHIKNYKDIHTNMILNNIGICYLLLDDSQEAIKYFENAKKSQFSILLSGINHASALLKTDRKAALDKMNGMIKDVIKNPIDRVRQRFYINYTHILYANGMDISVSLENAMKHKDRVIPDKTIELCDFYKAELLNNSVYDIALFKKLYCPCYLEYWYTEPLKLLSSNTIEDILAFH